MALEREFQFLTGLAERLIELLRAHLAEIRPAGVQRGAELAAHMEHAIGLNEQSLTELKARFVGGHETDQRQALTSVRAAIKRLHAVHTAAPFVDTGVQLQLPLGVLYFMNEAARDIVAPDVGVVARPDGHYMYSTMDWPLERILRDLKEDPEGATPIVCFYPALEH